MSYNVQDLTGGSQLSRKRLEAEDSDTPRPKRPRTCSPPRLSPCLGHLPQPRGAVPRDSAISQIGPYTLLDLQEGHRVHLAIHQHKDEPYLCKVYTMKEYHKVVMPYSQLPPHPNIAPIADIILGDQSAYVFRESGHGDMHSHVRRCKRLPEREAAAIFKQMTGAVAHCHAHGVLLRDLKLRKFVFGDKDRTKVVLENLEDCHLLEGPGDSLSDKHGCPAYVGPEILSTENYSGKAADVWSLGIVLYTMLVGHYPFEDTKPASLFSKIRRGVFSIPEGLSPKACCLIRSILRKEPSERLTAHGILLHPWLSPTGAMSEDSGVHPSSDMGCDQVVPAFEFREECKEEELEQALYS
ncbi:tribbles homolog 3 [Ambystoma mexicanum]|uniref:tribbles homolog 3 n=1 Tax=Ambystoma mexicanum TaxID=8296 RepID=UPI0037E8640A